MAPCPTCQRTDFTGHRGCRHKSPSTDVLKPERTQGRLAMPFPPASPCQKPTSRGRSTLQGRTCYAGNWVRQSRTHGSVGDSLVAAGLTRLGSWAVHDIGALDAGEAEEAVGRMLREFRVPREGVRTDRGSSRRSPTAGRSTCTTACGPSRRGWRPAEGGSGTSARRWSGSGKSGSGPPSAGRRRSDGIRDARFLVAELMRQAPAEGAN